jgi:hypothetical protein
MTDDALADQLAYYFSDKNLRHDRFLRRKTGPRGTGEVDVACLASFNRVKALTTDLDVVRAALRTLPELCVSDDGMHVWRDRPLPTDDDSDERTVYAETLRQGISREAIREVFSTFGHVVHISRALADAIPACAPFATLHSPSYVRIRCVASATPPKRRPQGLHLHRVRNRRGCRRREHSWRAGRGGKERSGRTFVSSTRHA